MGLLVYKASSIYWFTNNHRLVLLEQLFYFYLHREICCLIYTLLPFSKQSLN